MFDCRIGKLFGLIVLKRNGLFTACRSLPAVAWRNLFVPSYDMAGRGNYLYGRFTQRIPVDDRGEK